MAALQAAALADHDQHAVSRIESADQTMSPCGQHSFPSRHGAADQPFACMLRSPWMICSLRRRRRTRARHASTR